eukprot:1145262-Pelagomonas_calceolata.AAC.1
MHARDIVFLASDGVTDNFDPSILKLAKPPAPPKESVMLEVRICGCAWCEDLWVRVVRGEDLWVHVV